MKKLLALLLLAFCLPVLAESQAGVGRATASLNISITILPTMRIDTITPVAEGLEYRGYTNMKNATFAGTYVTFGRPGNFVKVVPAGSSSSTMDGPSYDVVSAP